MELSDICLHLYNSGSWVRWCTKLIFSFAIVDILGGLQIFIPSIVEGTWLWCPEQCCSEFLLKELVFYCKLMWTAKLFLQRMLTQGSFICCSAFPLLGAPALSLIMVKQHLFILISYFIMTCSTICSFRSNTQISALTRLFLDGIPVTGLSCEGIEQGYCAIVKTLQIYGSC